MQWTQCPWKTDIRLRGMLSAYGARGSLAWEERRGGYSGDINSNHSAARISHDQSADPRSKYDVKDEFTQEQVLRRSQFSEAATPDSRLPMFLLVLKFHYDNTFVTHTCGNEI